MRIALCIQDITKWGECLKKWSATSNMRIVDQFESKEPPTTIAAVRFCSLNYKTSFFNPLNF